ncbi:MAG: diguanylate cyclase [Desulfosarcinaceae bacterium]|nr:diguanylate cyclase [Desulfosarcinaceae bacterium]
MENPDPAATEPSASEPSERIRELETAMETLRQQCREKIKASLAKYRRVIDATSEGFLQLDLKHRIVDTNAAVEGLLGCEANDLLGRSVEEFYQKEGVYIHFASKAHLSFEALFETGKGRMPLLFKRSVLVDGEGRPFGYLVFLTDLTELKQAQEDLARAEARYRGMYENAAQGMYQSSLDGRLLRVNPAFARTFGYEQNELLGHPGGAKTLYADPADRQRMVADLKKRKVLTNYELELRHREGKPVWALVNARLALNRRGEAFIEGILVDNTDKRLAEEQLRRSRERFRYLANHDSLTDLFNTRYLYKVLDQLIQDSKACGEPFSLVFLDMDNFKTVVDTYGHLNGSRALKEVAATLKAELRDPAFGVAYGGDEFVLVLPRTGKMGALERVEIIRQRMKETVYLERQGLRVKLSASFGIATYPDDAQDRVGLLALADAAMFRIKVQGKDAVGISTQDG